MAFTVAQCKVCACAVREVKVFQSAEVPETPMNQGGGSESHCHFDGEKSDHNQSCSGMTPAGSLLLLCPRLASRFRR